MRLGASNTIALNDLFIQPYFPEARTSKRLPAATGHVNPNEFLDGTLHIVNVVC